MRVFTLHLFVLCRLAVEVKKLMIEQKMTFVDDTKEFRDCSMSVLHDSIWEN